MMNLKKKVESLGIKVFNGRYNGPKDLAEFVFGKYELKIILYKIINKIVATAIVRPA